METSWTRLTTKVVIPKPLLEILSSLDLEEGVLLLGSKTDSLIVVEGIAFVRCFSNDLGFSCVPMPRPDLIGVFHKHTKTGAKDLRISKLWELYLILENNEIKAYSYGNPVLIKVV